VTESQLFQFLNKRVHEIWIKGQIHSCRVENWRKSGTADWNLCVPIGEFWFELKVGHNKIKFQEGQIAWLYRRWRAGGRSYVVFYDKGERYIKFYEGLKAMELAKNGSRNVEDCYILEPSASKHKIFECLVYLHEWRSSFA